MTTLSAPRRRPPAAGRHRAAPRTPTMLLGAILVAVTLIGVLLLTTADASRRDVEADQFPIVVAAITFIALLIVLTLASISNRIQFGLQMFAIYTTIYLLLPGYHHMSLNIFPFYGMHYDDGVLRTATAIVSLFTVMLLGGYAIGEYRARRQGGPRLERPQRDYRLAGSMPLAAILTMLSIVFLGLLFAIKGPAQMFATRGAGGVSDVDSSLTALLGVLGSTILASFLYACTLLRFGVNRRAAWTFFALNLPIFIVTSWPPGLSRFNLFGDMLLFSTLIFDYRRTGARVLLPLIFVIGALVAMPVVDSVTRRAGTGESFSYTNVLDQYFSSGDFDGMQSVSNAALYGREHGFEGGRQLVSAGLFFVPRSFWSGKALPTGTLTAKAAGFKFTNISQPLPSEFYVDFGMAGVVLGGFLVGFGLARLDTWIDRNWEATPKARMIAGVLLAFSTIVFRGTLLGIISAPALTTIVTLVVCKLGLRRAAPPVRRPSAA